MTQPVAQTLEQPVEELEADEPFQPLKGIEEQDLSAVGAAGPGTSRYIGTPSGIQLCTPTLGAEASLEELQLYESRIRMIHG